MYQAVDADGTEVGPVQDANPLASYFFVIFIFLGSFFFLNFFVGVIFLNYEEAQKQEKESWFMTYRELEWVDVMKMIRKARPDFDTTNVPEQKQLLLLHKIVGSTIFDVFIMICIVLNMVIMGMTYDDEPVAYTNALLYINYIFSGIFLIECILKLIAYRHTYFKSSWNVFDFIVVIGSIVDILMSTMDSSSFAFLRAGPQLVRILRVLRVSRLLRLINKYPGLQALIKTIMFSLPSLLSVFSLLILIYFIFAILGVFIFNNVKEGDVIDGYVNFNNFGYAMVMCLRVSTGEDWNRIMFDTANTDSDCIDGQTCGTAIAPLYFIVFIVICSFIMLNLFILVIIQQFDQYYLDKDNVISKFDLDLLVFKESWTEYSKMNKCIKMKDNKLVKFFLHLKRPLGMSEEDRKDINELKKNIVQMGIRADDEGYIYFNELLYKVMRKTYGIKHIRNRKLAHEESITYAKINKIQKEVSRKDIWDDKKATAVNPFLAVMYYNISFKTWLNKARKRMELEALNDNIAGSEQSNEDFSDILHAPDEKSHVSEGSLVTIRQESIASSDSDFVSDSALEDSYSSSGIETIQEHELEDGEKEHPDASFEEDFKGKRLFDENEEEEMKQKMNLPTRIMETDERKEEDVLSEGERKIEGKDGEDLLDKLDRKGGKESQFDKRKSSAPEPDPYGLPKIEKKEDKLKIIEENNLEQTFSMDKQSEEDP